MSHNTFGHLFRVTTWGESHGPAIGCVVDGCPPRIPLTEADIQPWLDRRRPGQSRFTTQRQEPDEVRILSGVFDGLTTGTPIALQIDNVDQRSRDYSAIAAQFRPGHADLTYELKYGIRDYRGGGRSSARETAMRVAAGGVARKVLGAGVRIRGALVQIGPHRIDRAALGLGRGGRQSVLLPGPGHRDAVGELPDRGPQGRLVGRRGHRGRGRGRAARPGRADLRQARRRHRRRADVDQRGEGRGDRRGLRRRGAVRRGERRRDAHAATGVVEFASNHAGGILGGISTGQPIVARFAVKPTSSILTPRQTRRPRRAGDRDHHQGPPRPLRRHPRRAGGRGDAGLRAGRPPAAPPRAEPGRADHGAAAAQLNRRVAGRE